MNPFRLLKQILKNAESQKQFLSEVREGIANHADLTNRKMHECIELNKQMIALQQAQLECLKKFLPEKERMASDATTLQYPPLREQATETTAPGHSFKEAMANIPLMIADKTYNTAHPEYDAHVVRNYPGQIFNAELKAKNAVYQALLPKVKKKKGIVEVLDASWESVLNDMMDEVKTIPHSQQVFERKNYIENYVKDLSQKYHAHYLAGWVNMEDALFLYWVVRSLKPKTVVQTGVCNGLSTAFMMLGLVKNGSEGRLHVIDLPAIFDPKDPAWTVKDKVYGVVIPEGKSSGWMVPDAYHDRIEVLCGDAKKLLPKLVDELVSIDLFYHDSDHTYDHMTFEFQEAKRKLAPGGVILGDDISWNASLWDFADAYHVPAYNYKGAVGAAFF
jgi:predicted O-methyltransferase YrrM